MPRGLTSDMIAALAQPVLNPAIFIALTFGSISDHAVTPIPVYIWSGYGTVTWNSQTWIGLGHLLSLSLIDDNASVEAHGVTIKISGINPTSPTTLNSALTEVVLGLPVTVYLGMYSSGTLIDTPVTSWLGRMDQPTWNIGGDEITLTLACESRLLDMNCSVARRYTQEDQQELYPGDLGFQFVNSVQEMTIDWGLFPTNGNNI
jgi:hypothetical protein